MFYLDLATQTFTKFPLPTPLAGPLATFLAADGNRYMTEAISGKVARFDTKKMAIKYKKPLPLPAGLVCHHSRQIRRW